VARLKAAGASFHEWANAPVKVSEGETLVRFVTAFATSQSDVDTFLQTLG
jgi:threonine aldolase